MRGKITELRMKELPAPELRSLPEPQNTLPRAGRAHGHKQMANQVLSESDISLSSGVPWL